MGPGNDPQVEQRKTRFWLPLLVPVGCGPRRSPSSRSNLSRVFIAAAEESTNFTLVIGIGITLAILDRRDDRRRAPETSARRHCS